MPTVSSINANESYVTRVAEVIEEYRGWSTDPSPIDREGYSFRAKRNLRALRAILYPYVGILIESSRVSRRRARDMGNEMLLAAYGQEFLRLRRSLMTVGFVV